MVNDRLYIKCTECGERLMIGKYYVDVFNIWNNDKIEEFINNHLFYNEEKNKKRLSS